MNDNGRRTIPGPRRLRAAGPTALVRVDTSTGRRSTSAYVSRPVSTGRWRGCDDAAPSIVSHPARRRPTSPCVSRGRPVVERALGHEVRLTRPRPPTDSSRGSRGGRERTSIPTTSVRPELRIRARPSRRRPPLVRGDRARVPDLVGRTTGDAQGMDRPRVGERGRLGPCTRPSRHASGPAAQHAPTRRRSRRTGRRSGST